MALSEETSSIPLVDISPILSPTSTPRAREDVIKQLSSASQKYGFFQLTGHGIPLFLQREILLCSKRLFSLPLSQKQEKAMSRSPGLSKRGYEAIGGQKLASIPDTKEGFYIGVETPADDPKAGSFLTGPNFWPEGLRDDEFREPVMAYHEQVLELHESLLRILAEGLEGGVGLFDDFMVDPVANIKLLHYPPTASENQAEVPLGGHLQFFPHHSAHRHIDLSSSSRLTHRLRPPKHPPPTTRSSWPRSSLPR